MSNILSFNFHLFFIQNTLYLQNLVINQSFVIPVFLFNNNLILVRAERNVYC